MIFIYVVCANRSEAQKIGKACVAERLAACANYFPIESVYRWQGKVIQDKEYSLILKTRKENFAKAKYLVKKLHSYKVPCICAWCADQVEKSYLQWLKENSK